MKNILLLVPRLNIGGAETYVATLAVELKKEGFNIFVASGGGMLAEKLKIEGIRHFFLPIRLSVDISAYFLAKIVKKYKIDLIHANSAAAGITAVIVKKKYIEIPVVYTAHGVIGDKKREMILNECDKIMCVSDFLRQDAINKGFKAEKLVTIYNGIDLMKFQPNYGKKQIIRAKYHIPEDAFTLAIISRIKNLTDKGHGDILQVLEKYKEASNWNLLVIGKGKALGKLKSYLKKHNLEDRVHCLGHVIDVQNILDAVDVVVLPSKFETFGLVLAESMAMEKPVVTYAVGGTPEVIDNGVTGFLIEKNNIEDLYAKLLLLESDDNKCMDMGKISRFRVQEKFSLEKLVKNIKKVYNECKKSEI